MEQKQISMSIRKYPDLFRIIFVVLLILFMMNSGVVAQNKPIVLNELDVIHSQGAGGKDNTWIEFSDAQNSLYHYISAQAYPLLEKRAKEVSGLSSLSQWQKRQEWLRTALKEAVGPFPPKTQLNAKITRTIDKDGFKVEHIVYESQPGFYVTSSMFIPGGLKGKAPVVIYCSGHSANGYRGYQTQILNLVKKGFIVFAFDPVDQGERLEYFDPETNKPKSGGSDAWHSYGGAQALITGSSQIMYMMWDGIRAVDYLLTRGEVDPARIGITGRSGGGTQSAWISALDERIYAAAPESYITNFRGLFWGPGPQDAEQEPINGIARGIDLADLLLVRAPKPAFIIATTGDYFGIQGFRESAKEASAIYKAYGRESDFGTAEDILPRHGATLNNREAMYAFFQRSLNNPGDSREEKIQPLTEAEMQVTKTGQVYTTYNGETIFSLNFKEAEKLITKLQSSRSNLSRHIPQVQISAKKLSGYQDPSVIHGTVFTGRIRREGYIIEKYFVQGEGDYIIPYLLMIPEISNKKALLYLHPSGKSAEASVGGEMEWFVKNGFTVLAPDMIGIGEMGPGDFRGDSYIGGVSLNTWFCSMLIGRSITGIRAGDVVRLARLLMGNNGLSEVYALARREMAPVLLHAAAFDQAIKRIALVEPFASYQSIVANRFYDPKYIHSAVPGSLKAYDLPDLAASLAPRRLLIAGITDGAGKSADSESVNKEFTIIRTAYQNNKAEGQLFVVLRDLTEKPYDLFIEWIK
jgi:hypothetical protein